MAAKQKEKTEAAFRREFIEKCYEIVMKEAIKESKCTQKSVRVQAATKNYNRYINILRYGQKMCICIFRSGDIDIKLGEMCHAEHRERIFEYTTDPFEKEKFLDAFKNILKWLMPFGFGEGIVDMHTYMDYVSGGTGIVEAYDLLMQDIKRMRKKGEFVR